MDNAVASTTVTQLSETSSSGRRSPRKRANPVYSSTKNPITSLETPRLVVGGPPIAKSSSATASETSEEIPAFYRDLLQRNKHIPEKLYQFFYKKAVEFYGDSDRDSVEWWLTNLKYTHHDHDAFF